MSDDNKDLLDLCRLDLMEESVKGSPAVDRDETLDAIDYKRRQLVVRIGSAAPRFTEEQIVNGMANEEADRTAYEELNNYSANEETNEIK